MELDLKARLIFAFHHLVLVALQGEKGKGGEKRSFVLRSTSQSHSQKYGPTSVQPLYFICERPSVISCSGLLGAVETCGTEASVRG